MRDAGLNFNSLFYVVTDYGTIILLTQKPSRLTPPYSPVGLIVPAIHGLKIKCSCGVLALNLLASALIISIILLVLGIIIKWVFYYTIVKAGAKDAIRDSLETRMHSYRLRLRLCKSSWSCSSRRFRDYKGR